MKAYGGVDVQIHIFLTSTLVGGEWSASRPRRFTPGTHWLWGWVDPTGGLNDMEKRKFLNLPGLELRTFRRPARTKSLYRVRYWISRQEYYLRPLCLFFWWKRQNKSGFMADFGGDMSWPPMCTVMRDTPTVVDATFKFNFQSSWRYHLYSLNENFEERRKHALLSH
jgi:hypothetical protein